MTMAGAARLVVLESWVQSQLQKQGAETRRRRRRLLLRDLLQATIAQNAPPQTKAKLARHYFLACLQIVAAVYALSDFPLPAIRDVPFDSSSSHFTSSNVTLMASSGTVSIRLIIHLCASKRSAALESAVSLCSHLAPMYADPRWIARRRFLSSPGYTFFGVLGAIS